MPLTQASADLLQGSVQDTRQGSILLIKHPDLPWPESACVERDQQSFGRAVHLNLGTGPERYSGMICRSDELPFVEHSFQRVILWHVLGSEQQKEMNEASRVLAPGGELLILGLNSWGWRARSEAAAKALPRFAAHRLAHHLTELGLQVKARCGAGLLVWSRLLVRQQSLSGVLLPLTDLQAVVAEHRHPATLSPIRFKRVPAGMAPTA